LFAVEEDSATWLVWVLRTAGIVDHPKPVRKDALFPVDWVIELSIPPQDTLEHREERRESRNEGDEQLGPRPKIGVDDEIERVGIHNGWDESRDDDWKRDVAIGRADCVGVQDARVDATPEGYNDRYSPDAEAASPRHPSSHYGVEQQPEGRNRYDPEPVYYSWVFLNEQNP